MSNALQVMANRFSVSTETMQNIIMNTIMPNRGNGVTNEQFVSFVAVANEYGLNPLTKEVYAFPAKGGGIQPIVSIDGWLRIINSHPQFNGMVFEDMREDGKLIAVKCKIYKKEIDHPVEVVEYMEECYQPNKEPWKKWPSRMLRHKAAIQCGRYAFGLSGIIDPDEAERYQDVGVIEAEPVLEVKEDLNRLEQCSSIDDLMQAWKEIYPNHTGKPSIKQITDAKDAQKEKLKTTVIDQVPVEEYEDEHAA
jgi:phage recombination protein Bet